MHDIQHAVTSFNSGKFEVAEGHCRSVLAVSPGHSVASIILGQILLRRGAPDQVQPIVADALKKTPGHSDLLTLLGLALERLGRIDEALESFNRAVERRLKNNLAQSRLAELLPKRRSFSPKFLVTIVTPTLGNSFLRRAIDSVQDQTYPFIEHFVVVDGSQYHERVVPFIPNEHIHPIHLLTLPCNIGRDRFYGHRVFGAAPYLVNGRFIAYLDEDNFFSPDHIQSLMTKIIDEGLSWAYSLRRIVNSKGETITCDDCQSLGKWPTWYNRSIHLIDVNCYLVRRDIAIALSSIWHQRYCDEENEEGPDFILCRQLLKDYPRCGTNGRYTTNYMVENTIHSPRAEFFVRGNAEMRKLYPSTFPWRARDAKL